MYCTVHETQLVQQQFLDDTKSNQNLSFSYQHRQVAGSVQAGEPQALYATRHRVPSPPAVVDVPEEQRPVPILHHRLRRPH
jgi:hypothetical protein